MLKELTIAFDSGLPKEEILLSSILPSIWKLEVDKRV
jgi:hypothetical protein